MSEPSLYRLIELSETTSTNDEVKRLLPDYEGKLLVVSAMCQTAGRGQKGNKWESEPYKNLLYSIGVKPFFLPPRCQFMLLQAASLAVCHTLDEYAAGFKIKWPNDIYYGERKISGTLIENELCGTRFRHCVLGTGINVNQTEFSSYPPNPISLKMITGCSADPHRVLCSIIARFLSYYGQIEQGQGDAVHETYCRMLFRSEGFHAYRDAGGVFRARMERVEPDGHLLLVDTDGRLRRYGFKEVRYLLDDIECN